MLASIEDVKRYCILRGSRMDENFILDEARQCYTDIERYHTWEHRRSEGQIAAVADYVTGTAAVTQGLKAVTFSGSTLTAAMIDRHLQLDGTSGRWYTFASINTGAGTAVLDDPYEGSTVTAASITIRKRYYRLPPDFDKAEVAKETGGNKVIFWQTRAEFEANWSQISASGQVWNIVPAGASRKVLYNTGTVTMTQGSTTATIATGTPLAARDDTRRFRVPLFPKQGDFTIISTSGADYTLDRAWTDITVSAQQYQIDPVGEPMVELYPAPGGGNSSVHFYYYRVPNPLFVQTDYPTWPAEMNDLWKEATFIRCSGMKPSDVNTELDLLMTGFMRRQGYVANEVVLAGRWGMNRKPQGSGLPWNYAPYSWWR